MTDLRFIAEAFEVQAAEGDAAGTAPKRFNATVYNGGLLRLGGFFRPVVIDLAGLKVDRQDNPVLAAHDPARIVGHTDAIKVTSRNITASGLISGVGPDAAEVRQLAANGFPWQMSIGASADRMESVESGVSVTVNGRTFTGPLAVARQSTLREISFVSIGADSSTSATVAASQRGNHMLTKEEIQAIRAVGKDLSLKGDLAARYAEAEDKCLAGEITLDQLKAEALEALRDSRPQAPGIIVARGTNTGPDHLAAALMVRAGFSQAAEKAFGATVMEQSKRLHSAAMPDLCAIALRMDGRSEPHGRQEMIRAALSTGSMPTALGSSANKILASVYMTAPAPWRAFAAVKTAANFKTHTSVRPTFLGNLEEVGPGGEIKYDEYEEETYEWSVDTYARQLQVSRQAFINDDLSAFAEVLPSFGKAAARALNNLVATTILANAGSFWDASNSNYISGSTTNLSAAGLDQGMQKLRQMKDAEGNYLDLTPGCLLVPAILEATGRALLQSDELLRNISSNDNLPSGNVWKGMAQLAVDPRLGDSSYTGYSTTAWWLFAEGGESVVVGFLDGQQMPTLESFGLDADINHLAYGFRVYHDFGCALGDERGSIKSKGAA